jgi:hypothetical protein
MQQTLNHTLTCTTNYRTPKSHEMGFANAEILERANTKKKLESVNNKKIIFENINGLPLVEFYFKTLFV